MMLAWLVMAAITTVCLLYVMRYLMNHSQRNHDISGVASFVAVRTSEVEEELAAGRITESEAEQLLDDLSAESRYISQRGQYTFNQDSSIKIARWSLSALVAVVVVGTVALYQHLGFATEVAFTEKMQTRTATQEDISSFLDYRVRRYGRAEDWYYLANEQILSDQFDEAVQSYRRVLALLDPESADRVNVQVELAQALFYANNNKVSSEMKSLITDALDTAPNHIKALALKGITELDAGQYKQAILTWQQAIRLGGNRQERMDLMSGISAARKKGGITEDEIPSVISHKLQLQLVLDSGTIAPTDVFLVYAKIPSQPMPVAIQRISAAEFNGTIVLTNLDNLMPSSSLSDVERVDVVVKRSQQGAKDLTQGDTVGYLSSVPSDSDKIFKVNVAL